MFLINKRQQIDFERYFNVIHACGGAVMLEDLTFLMNEYYKEDIQSGNMKPYKYGKVARDVTQIEELELEDFNIYKSTVKNKKTGKPVNNKFIVLSSSGWYKAEKVARGEVNIAKEDSPQKLKFNAFKGVLKRESKVQHELLIEKFLENYEYLEQVQVNDRTGKHLQGRVEIDKFLNNDDILIESVELIQGRDINEKSTYRISIMYFSKNLVYKKLAVRMDEILAVMERAQHLGNIEPDAKLQLEFKCVNAIPCIVTRCLTSVKNYKRIYAFYASIHKHRIKGSEFHENKLNHYFTQRILDHVKFYYIDDKYNLIEY